MKNIFVIPTSQLTTLHFDEALFISPNLQISKTINSDVEGRNIYITSDEDINEGWHFNSSIGVNKQVFVKEEDIKMLKSIYGDIPIHLKKIILTTDPELIEDGVQAISDDFLKWFIKNPSCERVDIESYVNGNVQRIYEIIIPQKETKSHSFCETPQEKCSMNYCDENGCQNKTTNNFEICDKCNVGWQEAIENVLRTEFETIIRNQTNSNVEFLLESNNASYIIWLEAKYQAEISNNEDDIREAFRQGQENVEYTEMYGLDTKLTEQEWFAKFKKK
jgi:hypothetical protein